MAGTGIADSIMFTAALIVAVGFIGVFGAVIGDASQQLNRQGDRVSGGLRTEVIVLNDPDAMQTAPLLLYVKNTGRTTLTLADTSILLDGVPATNVTFDVLGQVDDTSWPPGAIVQATVHDLFVDAGQHRVRVVTENAIEDSLLFRA